MTRTAGRLSTALDMAQGTKVDQKVAARIVRRLGRWSTQAIEAEMARMSAQRLDPGERMARWASNFRGAPMVSEASLKPLGRRQIRVDLTRFDCITLVYHSLALSRSGSFGEYVEWLSRLRYAVEKPNDIDNDARSGNFIHFVCESLIERAVAKRWLTNVTPSVAEATGWLRIGTIIAAHRRQKHLDPEQQWIAPLSGPRRIEHDFAATDALARTSLSMLRPGDIVLTSKGGGGPTLISHCFVITGPKGANTFVHANMNGYFLPDDNTPHHALQLCGVCDGAQYGGDDTIIEIDGRKRFGYVRGTVRRIESALNENYVGFLVLRPAA